jgi:hypothetical protein
VRSGSRAGAIREQFELCMAAMGQAALSTRAEGVQGVSDAGSGQRCLSPSPQGLLARRTGNAAPAQAPGELCGPCDGVPLCAGERERRRWALRWRAEELRADNIVAERGDNVVKLEKAGERGQAGGDDQTKEPVSRRL